MPVLTMVTSARLSVRVNLVCSGEQHPESVVACVAVIREHGDVYVSGAATGGEV